MYNIFKQEFMVCLIKFKFKLKGSGEWGDLGHFL